MKPVYSFLIALSLFPLAQKTYAQLEELDNHSRIENIPSLEAACKSLNQKLLVHLSDVFYFKECSLHPITDVDLINYFIEEKQEKLYKISTSVFTILPIGRNYTYSDFNKDFKDKNNSLTELCHKFEGKVVSANDDNYYYIADCKKNKFINYNEAQKYKHENQPIYAIEDSQLEAFPSGHQIKAQGEEKSAIQNKESLLETKLPNKYVLCRKLNNRFVAFHESYFYVEKCKLLPLKELNLTLQKYAEKRGGIEELTIEQFLGLERGKEIDGQDLLKNQ